MADGKILYDGSGNAVGRMSDAGMVSMDMPDATAAPVAVRPVTAPAPVEDNHSPAVTTQQVQGAAEYTSVGDVQGGDTYVPFGPVIKLQTDQSGVEVDPGYTYAWTEGGARRTFRIAPSIGLMPLLRFAHAAKAGMDTDDLEGMAALYDMIQDCVHPDDWDAFQSYSIMTKAEDEDLMEFVSAAMEIISARPRKPRGSSSATSRKTLPKSRANSSGPATVIPPGAIQPPEADGLMPVGDMVR